MLSVRLSRIRNTNGWSARNVDRFFRCRKRKLFRRNRRGRRRLGSLFVHIDKRFVNDRRNQQLALDVLMPEKSALSENASHMPIDSQHVAQAELRRSS